MSGLPHDRVEVKSDTQADNDFPHLALYDLTTPRAPARPEYMVHPRYLKQVDARAYSTDPHLQSASSTPDKLDRRDDYGDAARLGTNGQNLGRYEVAGRHVGRIRTEGHPSDQAMGDYGDRPRWLGSCKSGRPDHGLALKVLS